MATTVDKIKQIEDEMAKTQKNKWVAYDVLTMVDGGLTYHAEPHPSI